jgi:hypothetical protein
MPSRARREGSIPNISRNAALKCAEEEKPPSWAASVSEAPFAIDRKATPIAAQLR